MRFPVLLRYSLNFDQFLNVYNDLVIFARPVYPVYLCNDDMTFNTPIFDVM